MKGLHSHKARGENYSSDDNHADKGTVPNLPAGAGGEAFVELNVLCPFELATWHQALFREGRLQTTFECAPSHHSWSFLMKTQDSEQRTVLSLEKKTGSPGATREGDEAVLASCSPRTELAGIKLPKSQREQGTGKDIQL